MAIVVEIPFFQFSSAFYYPQTLDALIAYKRANVPELTDESEFEPLIQMLRAFALVSHLNATLVDIVANETFLPTAQLTDSVRAQLALIDYQMKPAGPAQVDVLYALAKEFAAAFQLVPPASQAATENDGVNPVIIFEAIDGVTIDRTDRLKAVLADDGTGVFTDWSSYAIPGGVNAGTAWAPWSLPAVKAALYFGHGQVMWDDLNLFVSDAQIGSGFTGLWEYYDGNFAQAAPSSVTNLGTTLRFDLTSYLGSSNRAGTKIRVQLNSSGAIQDVESTWTGSANIAVTGFLGQGTPSVVAGDYTVGSDWQALLPTADGTNGLTGNPGAGGAAKDVKYALPQTLTKDWIAGTVDGVSGVFIRFRVCSVSSPVSPKFKLAMMDTGKQYVLLTATQGLTTVDPSSSSDGSQSLTISLVQENFISGSEVVTVSGEQWTRVTNFLASRPTDKHYVVQLGSNDRASIVFGDGNAGLIPPPAVGNISVQYRYGAQDNGNVGAGSISVDKTGLTYVSSIVNPRPATGWVAAEGSHATSLAKAKIAGPASIRTQEVALGPDDVVALVQRYVDPTTGARPFARARAFEEGFGPKTIEVVVVTQGATPAPASVLAALQTYLDGDSTQNPPIPKRVIANQQAVVVNFSPKTIDITATVTSRTAKSADVAAALTRVFQPNALKDDGVTYQWLFGDTVFTSRIVSEIFKADSTITRVVLSLPAADVPLQARELPQVGTVSITVVAP